MLPRAERIGTTEFRRAFENGRVLRNGVLQLRIHRRESAIEYSKGAVKGRNAPVRAAFVVSRKSGKATVRNDLRRRVREIYRLSLWRCDARLAGTDLLFFASSPALTASNEALHQALDELLERVARAQQDARSSRAGTSSVRASHHSRAKTLTSRSAPTSRQLTADNKLMKEASALDVRPDDAR